MALRIELWERGTVIDGVEEWWDGVERAIAGAEDDYPILDSISPYGELIVAHDRLRDLAAEASRLAATTSGRVSQLLLRIAALCERATATTDAELRFDGD
jgi:hypothetical protein